MQKCFPEQLDRYLAQQFPRIIILNGSDALLTAESKDTAMHFARQMGVEEISHFQVDSSLNWDQVFQAAQSFSLFSAKQLFIFQCGENLTKEQHTQFEQLFSQPAEDIYSLLLLPKLTKATEQQAWYQTASQHGLQVYCQTLEIEKLPFWIEQRAKKLELALDKESIQFLAYHYEGNLLALKQALTLLQLHYHHEPITLPKTESIVETANHFTPFQWTDALLNGKAQRALHILAQLQIEEVQAVILLRTVQRELTVLFNLVETKKQTNLDDVLFYPELKSAFDRLKIWQNKRALYTQACKQLTHRKLFQLAQKLMEIESTAKQFSEENWKELSEFSLFFAS